MKTFELLSLIATGATIAIALSWVRPGAEPRPDRIHREGIVSSWRLDMDGTLYLRLDHQEEGGRSSTWFRTPPDRSVSTHVEEMLLDVLLAEPARLGIIGEKERALEGEDPKDALPLVSVSREATR